MPALVSINHCLFKGGLRLTALVLLAVLAGACGLSVAPDDADDRKRHAWEQRIDTIQDSMAVHELIDSLRKANDLQALTVAYLQLGKLQRHASKFYEALATHQKGRACADSIHDTVSVIRHYNHAATCYRRLGLLEEASVRHYRALALCAQMHDQTSDEAVENKIVGLNGAGNVHLTLGNYAAADSAFRLALLGEAQLGSEIGRAINYANIGSIFEKKGQVDSARAYYQRSLEWNMAAGSNMGVGLVHNHFGELYEQEGKMAEAIAEYNVSLELLAKENDMWHWLDPCISLVDAYMKMDNYVLATEYLQQGEETAECIGANEALQSLYHQHYLIAERNGDAQSALEYYRKSRDLSDRLTNMEVANNVSNLRVQYTHDLHENEINLMEAKVQNDRLKQIAIIAVLGAILFVMFVVVYLLMREMRRSTEESALVRKLEKMRSTFFTNITHEFRTPLAAIIGLSDDIANGRMRSGHNLTQAVQIIHRQGTDMLDLVNQMLDLSKVNSQITPPRWQRGNIVRYVAMLVECYRPLAQHKHVALRYSVSQPEIVTDFVADYMTKIVRNLMSNAIKYTPEDGRVVVEVQLEEKKRDVILRVSDTGQGISEQDLPHVFEPFYVANRSNVTISCGVGLALVQELVTAMKGEAHIESQVGQGTVVTVRLPLLHMPDAEEYVISSPDQVCACPREEDAPKAPQLPMGQREGHPVVLIVEDVHDIAYYIGAQLDEHYQLYYAHDGREGLERALSLVPDIIVTDLMMPAMDGLEMTKRLRASEVTNHIPIIVITAKVSEEDRVRGLETGVDAYLTKPFNSVELRVRVERLLESRAMLQKKYTSSLRVDELKTQDVDKADSEFLMRVVEKMNVAMAQHQPTDVDAMASAMCMSARQFSRKIQAITGDAPTMYLNRVKIARAKQALLQHLDWPVAEVALYSGFEDAAYFGKIFRQIEGTTPSLYRKKPN
ncbi:MAG: response regulator [Bacteroidaceae bacterium]|nr:response regulator [Bacteroidaceae bacterium]